MSSTYRMAALVIVFSLLLPHSINAKSSFVDKLGKIFKYAHEINQGLWLLGDPAAERRFGYAFSRFMMLLKPLDKNSERNAWVRKVFQRVVEPGRRNRFQYRVYVVRDKSINAFALPGGYVFVNRGMLDFVKSDDELACILGHELAHCNRRHSLYRMRRNFAFVMLARKVWKDEEDKQTWAAIANMFLELRFSRNNEREADTLGMEWAKEAGYNPSGMVTLWERMLKKYGDKKNDLTKRFATHPGHRERADNARKLLKEWSIPFKKTDFLTYRISTPTNRELLENGSFEGDERDGIPTGWRQANGVSVVENVFHDGKKSLFMQRLGRGAPCQLLSTFKRFKKGMHIELSGSVRNGAGRPNFWLGLQFYNEKKELITTIYPAANGVSPPMKSWTNYAGSAGANLDPSRRPPDNAYYFSVIASAGRIKRGECWLDSVSLKVTEGAIAPALETAGGTPRGTRRPNILPNGSFEIDGDQDGKADRWVLSRGAKLSTQHPDEGTSCLCITGEQKLRREFAVSELIPINPGSRYVMEGRFRAQPPGQIDFGYRLYTRDKRIVPNSTYQPKVDIGRANWTTREVRITVQPGTGAEFIQLTIRARPPVGHKIWMDNIKLFNADVR